MPTSCSIWSGCGPSRRPATGCCPAGSGSGSASPWPSSGGPEVLVLDEPTAGMDPEARAATRAIVAAERDAGAAILLTSHDLTDVERLADRIVIIDAGRVVASGTPEALRAGAVARLRFRLDRALGTAQMADLQVTLTAVRARA